MSDRFLNIKNHPELLKDKNSGAIINVDNKSLNSYNIQKGQKLLAERRLSKLENDMRDIKDLLGEIYKEIKK